MAKFYRRRRLFWLHFYRPRPYAPSISTSSKLKHVPNLKSIQTKRGERKLPLALLQKIPTSHLKLDQSLTTLCLEQLVAFAERLATKLIRFDIM